MDSLSRGHIKTKRGTPPKNGVGGATERFNRHPAMIFFYISMAYQATIMMQLSAIYINRQFARMSRQ